MDKKKAREILAVLLAATAAAWEESDEILLILAGLHNDIKNLLVNSGLYNQADLSKLMSELDAILLRRSLEMDSFMAAAAVSTWLKGAETVEKSLSLVELTYVKGLSGLEKDMIHQFLTIDRISGLTGEMRSQVESQVLSAIMLEKTPQQAMSYITNIIGIRDQRGYRQIGTTGISAKAERIVRTELLTINNAGAWHSRVQALQQFPDLQQIWIATGDGRTRFDHLAAHGQCIKVGELFLVGGESARFPGDPNLSPRQRCNCRCNVLTYREEWGEISDIVGVLDDKIKEERQRRGGV
ncbi:MAG: hypothetical protein JW908_00630 [Anaerolineales bacterium]|nr:hypothetical protein [Anaerolineales bacterium]